MKKNHLLLTILSMMFGLFLTACSGTTDNTEDGGDGTTGQIEGPLTLTVDKTAIEANGKDVATFTVKDKNGQVLTGSQYSKEVYIQDLTENAYLDRGANTYVGYEDGDHKFKAFYHGIESNELTLTVQNRKKYETFYHNVAVFQLTGSWCVNCPASTANLDKLSGESDRLIRLAFHSAAGYTDPFDIPQTPVLLTSFKMSGYPSIIYNLDEAQANPSYSDMKKAVHDQLVNYVATCGIKINTTYNAENHTISATANLTSSTGGEYSLVYAFVTDGLEVPNSQEGIYNEVVLGVTENYMKPGSSKLFKVEAGEEYSGSLAVLPTTQVASTMTPENSRLVVYALRQVNGKYIIDNIAQCSFGGSVNYKYNK